MVWRFHFRATTREHGNEFTSGIIYVFKVFRNKIKITIVCPGFSLEYFKLDIQLWWPLRNKKIR